MQNQRLPQSFVWTKRAADAVKANWKTVEGQTLAELINSRDISYVTSQYASLRQPNGFVSSFVTFFVNK